MKMLESFEQDSANPTIFVAQSAAKPSHFFNGGRGFDHYDIQLSRDAAMALLMLPRIRPQLLVLDTEITRINWLEFYSLIRKDPILSATPVLILADKIEKVGPLADSTSGITDFIIEPFTPQELLLRIQRLLQNQQALAGDRDSTVISYEDLRVDAARHETVVKGEYVKLTATEFRLLTTLARRRGRVQSRDRLLRDVCQYNSSEIETRTIDTHMRRLRNKLGSAGWHLETIRGVGYRFRETLTDA